MTSSVPTLEQLKEKAKALPDSKFPDWIFTITFHQFEDFPDYWSNYDMSDPRAELLQTMSKIRDVRKYMEYHRIWEEYISDVAARYCVDPQLIPDMFRIGLVREYIPDEPRLSKKVKENRKFLKTGKLPFIKAEEGESIMKAFVQDTIDSYVPDPNEYGVTVRLPTKEERAILEAGSASIAAEKRMAEFKQPAVAKERHIEFVGDYFRGFHSGEYDQKPQVFTEDGIDFDLLLKNAEEEAWKPDFIKDAEQEAIRGTKFVGGKFLTYDKYCNNAVAAALIQAGINPVVLYKGGMMSKKQVFIASARAGVDLDQIDNPKKWEKKKRKKEKKLMKRHSRKLGSMASMLTANGFSDGFGNMDNPINIGVDDEDIFKL